MGACAHKGHFVLAKTTKILFYSHLKRHDVVGQVVATCQNIHRMDMAMPLDVPFGFLAF